MTIISNNCSGAFLMRKLDIGYNSPTIFLQILPNEFPRFCKNLREYMEYELIEYVDFSNDHKESMMKLLGFIPTFPCGLLNDIAILFQHETSFNVAKEKWDRRKARIDYEHIGYMFCLEYEVFKASAIEFMDLNLPNSVVFTRDFDIPAKHYRYHVPDGLDYLTMKIDGRFVFEGAFNRYKFLENIRK